MRNHQSSALIIRAGTSASKVQLETSAREMGSISWKEGAFCRIYNGELNVNGLDHAI
jgi:hypothetical protein